MAVASLPAMSRRAENPDSTRPRRSAKRAATGRLLRVFLVVFALLLSVRLLLPIGLRVYVNRVLDDIPGYAGEIGKLDLNLWRGAYEVEDLRLLRSNGAQQVPFLEAQRLDLSLTWQGLLAGRLVGEAVLHHPVVTFVDAESEEASQTGKGPAWTGVLDALFPFGIERFVLRDGELRFEAQTTDPKVDVYVSDLYLEARNLTDVRGHDPGDPLLAEAEAAGRPFGTGELEVRLRFDPRTEQPRFELDASVRKVELTDLNDFLRAYGRVDAESGTFEMFTEFAGSDGEVEGYVKTLFADVDLVSAEEIHGPGDALEAFWEGLVQLGAELLENKSDDRVAAYVPLRGRTDNVDSDLLTIIASLLRNAFVAAMRPAIEDSIELGDLEVVKGKPKPERVQGEEAGPR
jgi:hypothetical protein